MLSYITLGVSDIAKAEAFYTELLAPLGMKILVKMDRIIFFGKSMSEPMLSICIPYDESDPHPGNGNMFALAPGTKEKVDEMHALALSLGAKDEGQPGQRIPDVFYGGYFRDPDGNKGVFNHFG